MKIFESQCELWIEETRNFTGRTFVGTLVEALQTIPNEGLFSIWIQPENVRCATVCDGILYSDFPGFPSAELRKLVDTRSQ